MFQHKTIPALCALALALAACQQAPEEQEASAPAPSSNPAPSSTPDASPSTDASPAAPATEPAALVPDAEKGETGARAVLLDWARALELGDYAKAYAQWGDNGARSGMSPREFADYWGKFKTITVSVPEGTMDAGAGSVFYTVPTTIVGKQADGKPYRLEGTTMLRRVNDVPGATPAQLHWHIESSDLKPVS